MLTPPATLCAILFTAAEPFQKKDLAKLLAVSEDKLVPVFDALREMLTDTGLALIETEQAVELRTTPDAAPILKKLREDELSRDLGKGSLETLAVIAYKDGVTRSEIDWVRGVNSSASLRTLLMRGLIEGREDPKDKRRLCYRLTTEALAHLGIATIADLPRSEELQTKTDAVLEEKEIPAEDPITSL